MLCLSLVFTDLKTLITITKKIKNEIDFTSSTKAMLFEYLICKCSSLIDGQAAIEGIFLPKANHSPDTENSTSIYKPRKRSL